MIVTTQMQLNNLKNWILNLENITQNSFGNGMLYYMSKPSENSWSDTAILADKIWLIGRAYAASPERRFTFKKGTKKVNYSHGNGTGKYFKHIAEYIMKHYDNNNFWNKYMVLNSPYKFDNSKEDVEKLELSIKIVYELNELIKKASGDFDANYNKELIGKVNYKNQISFCSKFLHFHFPHSVFIFDSFTFDSGNLLCQKSCRRKVFLDNVIMDSSVRNEIVKHKVNIDTSFFGDNMSNYITHCINSYMICCFIKNDLNINSQISYPRMSDRIFQNIKP